MKKVFPDINCDLGEGVGNEADIMPYIGSCNIACGGHAGSPDIMRTTVELALSNGVHIGAHPSYPDRKNFGRVSQKLSPNEFIRSLDKQLNLLTEIISEAGGKLHHIKAHGALYNDLSWNMELAGIYLDHLERYKTEVILYVLSGSDLSNLARRRGFWIRSEVFGDRNYNDDLSLVSRKSPHALLTSKEAVLAHVTAMVEKGEVKTITGKRLPIAADTVCIHSDTPGAVELLQYLNQNLIRS